MMNRKPLTIAALLVTMIALVLGVALTAGFTRANAPGQAANAAAPNVEYTLITGGDTGKLVFVGVGGEIDGVVNPTLTANPGDVVQITLINATGCCSDLRDRNELNAPPAIYRDGQGRGHTSHRDQAGEFVYYCSLCRPASRDCGACWFGAGHQRSGDRLEYRAQPARRAAASW